MVDSEAYGGPKTAPKFVSIMMKLKMEWDKLAKDSGLKNVA